MRVTMTPVIIFMMFVLFAMMASAHHVQCAGKALAAPTGQVKQAAKHIKDMGSIAWYLDPNSCEVIACKGRAQVRWCNEDTRNGRSIMAEHIAEGAYVLAKDCETRYNGKSVAGGYLTHDDNWSVIVQDAQC
ncbi:uncharacterized protein DSM5745_02340 [Aspergillus mulundensis]|uniref:Uncharacterized protein n=1 Tax=Aspergillus mulundensis TaxID=1810919 RepID=A0A3D8SW91_9EURO|nr:hypothetical protein DSM5745_02340 [Aspergillus mulundensis]RDW90565.1 hypothetical protein DSM5745_02340 [Aspergillus mulundensis]